MPHVSPRAAQPSLCPGSAPGAQVRRQSAELPPKIGLEMRRNATHPSNFHHQQRGLILSTIYFKGLKSAATSSSQASPSTPFPKPAPRAGGATRLSPHLHPLSPCGEASGWCRGCLLSQTPQIHRKKAKTRQVRSDAPQPRLDPVAMGSAVFTL